MTEQQSGTADTTRAVSGRVARRDGSTAAGVPVTVTARRLRSEQLLGEAVADADGTFRVGIPGYPPGVPLVVRAGVDGSATEVLLSAGAGDGVVDLVLPAEQSTEYAELLAAVTPLLDGAHLADLGGGGTPDDIGYLARAVGHDMPGISRLAAAARLARATGRSAEAFYGLLSQGLPGGLADLAQRRTTEVRAALAAAVDAGTVASSDDAGELVAALRACALNGHAEPPARNGHQPSPLAGIFGVAVPDPEARERLFTAYLDHEDGRHAFQAGTPDDEHAERLQLALHLGTLTDHNAGLVGAVLTRFDSGELRHLRELVRLDGDWARLVEQNGGVPERIGGGADDYAEAIRTRVAEAHPTAHIAFRLAEQPEHAGAPATRFLRANPEFDLTATPVHAGTVPDAEARDELAAIQRTFKVTKRFDAMQAVREQGFASAHDIAGIAPEAFAARLDGALDAAEAKAVHARATQVHAAAVNLAADLRTAARLDVPWLPDMTPTAAEIPDWEDLFLTADYPAVEDSRSVCSPAAYLVDLLYYLRRLGGSTTTGPSGDGPIADVLYARRPDLWEVDLSKENTELALPYVDLVNELLESAVAPDTRIPAEQRQSTGDAAALRVQPQHVNTGAYDRLRDAVYPWGLPFDLWEEQAGTYFDHLGVSRDSLLATLGLGNTGSDTWARLRTAAQLGLSYASRQIIAGEPLTPPRELAEMYGRPAATPHGKLVLGLSNVRALLDTAGLRLADLTALLETRFVNPGGRLTVTPDPLDPYNTGKMTLTGLDIPALDRLHRFVRLHRAVGGTAAELDRLIQGANNQGLLDAATLRCIVTAKRLAARVNLPVERVVAFCRPLDTYRYPSDEQPPLYDRLFLDPALVAAPVGAPSPFALNADRTELNVIGSLDTPAVSAALLAVLEITDEDLDQLVRGPNAAVANKTLNLAHLSVLVTAVVLARFLRLPVRDLLRLVRLRGNAPWSYLTWGSPGEGTEAGAEPASGAAMTPPADPPRDESEHELSGAAPMAPPGPGAPVAAAAPPPLTLDQMLLQVDAFLDAVEPLTARGCTVAEIDAVLTASLPAQDGPVPDDTGLAATLTELRAALQSVYRQTERTTDEKGDLTRRNLALLGWDSGLVQDAVSTLLGTTVYSAPLAALPPGLSLPTDLPVRYEHAEPPNESALRFTGPMEDAQKDRLLALSSDPAFQGAVEALYQAPRAFLRGRMKCLRLPLFSTELAALPPGYRIPGSFEGKVYHDITAQQLCLRGYLGEAEVRALKSAPGADDAFKAAVGRLVAAQEDGPGPGNGFLVDGDNTPLFAGPGVTPADRFHYVLEKLAPHLRRMLGETAAAQQLGRAAKLDPATASALLGTWLRGAGGDPMVQVFLAAEFVGSDAAVEVTRASFGPQFTALSLLHRVALVLGRFAFTAEELPFLFRSADHAWLDLNALPPGPVGAPSPQFPDLVALASLARLRDVVPGGLATVEAVFRVARRPNTPVEDVATELSRRTGWDRTDILGVARSWLYQTAPQYADVAHLAAVQRGVAMLRRLGVGVYRAYNWLKPQLTAADAQAAWLAAKAAHSAADWTNVAGPIQDTLRDRQRAALVAYLVANPLLEDGTPLWRDANGMHDYFLLDVEMSAVQLTTRIAQAAYSIQLFVQRCLLNLEPRVTATDSPLWAQWEWMKQYRLWEANQKVFLYPENYFEPELRADKSPLFAQLETDLMQKDLTDDNVRGALLNYLEGLDDIARLQPSGVYVDYDPNLPPENHSGETVHVMARRESAPRTHYYRTWVNRQYWTPWQQANLDIDGDALTLGLWQNRLYAFWPLFIPAGERQEITNLPDGNPHRVLRPGSHYWQIKMNWSEYRNGTWTPKHISDDVLVTNPQLPDGWVPATNLGTPYLDPSDRSRYLFVVSEDYYTKEPVVWCHHARHFEIGEVATHQNHYSTIWGRFRLSRRRGAMVAEPMSFSAIRNGTTTPTDPEGKTGRLGADLYLDFMPPPNTRTVNNDWVELQDGNPQSRQFMRSTGSVLLRRTPLSLPFRVTVPHQALEPKAREVAFFTDSERSYLLTYVDGPGLTWRFTTAYHPHVELLKSQLDRFGVDALFDRRLQAFPEEISGVSESFEQRYSPNPFNVYYEYPGEPMEFDIAAPYAVYNWELFFHTPLLTAQRLSTHQQFAAAQTWFHRIFDPTDRSTETAPRRYWHTKPFYETSTDPTKPGSYFQQRIEEVMKRLATGDTTEAAKVDAWLRHPFQPDVVARLRTTAYQKAVVMKYLDNLIAWGDQLFRQDTLEAINQATQLYVLAAELLGRRPEEVPRREQPAVSYRELTVTPPTFLPAVVAAEHMVPAPTTAAPAIAPGLGTRWLDYFGIPRNDKLLGYWDIVDDRLFKIRHGQSLEGVARRTQLFGAAIDPAVLARATSAGLDLSTVLDDMSAPLPHYRFGPMIAKAKELANHVAAFGSALLSALEKRDAEALARLRSTHERSVLDAVLNVRTKQKEDADKAVDVLTSSKAVAEDKKRYYTDKTKRRMNDREEAASDLVDDAKNLQHVSAGITLGASALALLPELKIGFPTTVGAKFGGNNIYDSLIGLAQSVIAYLGVVSAQAQQSFTLGGFDHRFEDWGFGLSQAEKEIGQFDTQIAGASIRKDVAQNELDSHKKQIANAKEADEFLYAKFTGEELYDWMVGQLGTTYFQAYQLAYDVAKRAERAYRHELGLEQSDFIRFGYWDSLHKGLLAGERLTADLNRMDAAYYEENARELELSTRVSLAKFDPAALLSLKETGKAYISLPEALFDLDTPGHFMRRIKTVAVTVPCVAGPYTGVNLTLSLLKSSVRVESRLSDGKYARQPADARFRDYIGPIESIVTSTGQEDHGLFEANLHDERFLPFEGAGAVSEWALSLPADFRQFDYETITDVVLHVRYTAREAGGALARAAVDELRTGLNEWLHAGGGKGLHWVFSARRDFSAEWGRFLGTAAGAPATMTFRIGKDRFPYLFRDEKLRLAAPELVLVLRDDPVPGGAKRYVACYGERDPMRVTLAGPRGTSAPVSLLANPGLGGQPTCGFDGIGGDVSETGEDWVVTVPAASIAGLAPELLREGRLNPDAVEDLLLVWRYTVEKSGVPG